VNSVVVCFTLQRGPTSCRSGWYM